MKRIAAFFNAPQTTHLAAGILIITLALSNILGVVRDHFLARVVPTHLLDAYYAAFRIPDLLFNLLIFGAVTAAFIPIFKERLARDDSRDSSAWELVATMMSVAVVVLTITVAAFIVLMPALMPLVVPSFDAERLRLAVQLGRIMMLSPFFFGFSYILGGVLNATKRFTAYSIAPLVYNLSIIGATVIFAERFGPVALAWGVVAGALLHFLVQLPTALRAGLPLRFAWNLTTGILDVFKLMGPRVVALGVGQFQLIVYTVLGSGFVSGSIAAFNFANNIQTMPTVVFGTSFATASFPTLTEYATARRTEDFSAHLLRVTRMVVFILIPLTVGLFLLRAQLVRLILGFGQFSWSDTRLTLDALGALTLSLVPQGLLPVFARAFYAIKNTAVPMWAALINLLVSTLLALWFTRLGWGVSGLAYSLSAGATLNAVLLYWWLRPHLTGWQPRLLAKTIGVALLGALIMGEAIWLALRLLNGTGLVFFGFEIPGLGLNTHSVLGLFGQTAAVIALGAAVYYFVARLLGAEELRWLGKRFLQKNDAR